MKELYLNEEGMWCMRGTDWDITIHCNSEQDRLDCLKLLQRNNPVYVVSGICPTCFERVDRTNYCPNCGQKLNHTE